MLKNVHGVDEQSPEELEFPTGNAHAAACDHLQEKHWEAQRNFQILLTQGS